MMRCWLSPTSTATSPSVTDYGGIVNSTDFYNNNYYRSPPSSTQPRIHPQHLHMQQNMYVEPEQQQVYYRSCPLNTRAYNHHHNQHPYAHHLDLFRAVQIHHQDNNHLPNNYNAANVLMDSAISSTSRQQRNIAEKMRRDKINKFINELATLNPMVSTAKRTDKTSILRLAVTFLRMHNILIPGTQRDIVDPPSVLENVDFSKFVLDELEGIMLIVTSAGKIIFVSHTVQQVLGHEQRELFGNSLYNFTCIEDHKELDRNLRPDESECAGYSSTSEGALDDTTSSSESSSSFVQSPSPGSSTAASTPSNLYNISSSEGSSQRFRRSFYLRLKQRTSRNDQPQYELVHVVGHLRVPDKRNTSTSSSSSKRHKSSKDRPITNNDIILVAMVKPCKNMGITELSLLEANRDEYITRHLVDGRIVYADHRIAVVAGYMVEEVTGVFGFNYMHKDDVRWTMIALRQMYYRGESYGTSCYRLQTKTGQFIYLRTHGYLELGEDNESVQSIVCINSLVSEEEGEELIRKMKCLFSPLITEKCEPGIDGIADNHIRLPESTDGAESDGGDCSSGELEDPGQIEIAVKHLIFKLPAGHKPNSPGPLSDTQCVKLYFWAQRLPPLEKQSSEMGISPPILRAEEEEKPAPKQIMTDMRRPSVIRRTMSENRFSGSDHEISVDVKKMKIDKSPILVEVDDNDSHRVAVVVANRAGGKRQHIVEQKLQPNTQSLSPNFSEPSQNALPLQPLPPSLPPIPLSANPYYGAALDESFSTVSSILNPPEELQPLDSFLFNAYDTSSNSTQLEFRAPLSQLDIDPPTDDLPQTNEIFQALGGDLQISHRQLETSMEFQATQIDAIEEDLHHFDNIDNQVYSQVYLNKLKAQQQELSCCYKEHKEQRQELRSLQQDTLSIQQNIGGNI